MALAIDASTPSFVANTVTSISTASFTPPVGSLLVVGAVSTPFSGNPNFVVTSTSLTFQPLTISNVAGQSTAQMFVADVGAFGGSSRTVSVSSSGFASIGLKVWVVTGQHATLYLGVTSIGNTTANAFNAGITTDSANNWTFACGADFNDLGAPTSTDVGEGVGGLSMSYLVVRKAAATTSAGPETLNFDSPGTNAAAWAWAAVAVRPDTYSPSSDASLWVPLTSGIILPQSPLYFPFMTPWAGQDVTSQSATGVGDVSQHTSTAALATKAGSGPSVAQVRPSSATAGSRTASQPGATVARVATSSTGIASQGATGVGVVAQRAADQSTGQKAATGTASASQRTAVSATGFKSATGTATAPDRSSSAATGKKATSASGASVARAASIDTGSKATTGTGQVPQRTAGNSTGAGSTGVTGNGAVQSHASTSSTGSKGAVAPTSATCRVSSAATGIHRGVGIAAVYARSANNSTGLRRASGTAVASTRSSVAASCSRSATGGAGVRQRAVVVGFGAQVIPPTYGTASAGAMPIPTASAATGLTASASAAVMTVPTATGG